MTEKDITYIKGYLKNTNIQLDEMELFASENKIPIIDKHAAVFLDQIVKLYKPQRILEIGMAIGYSAIRMMLASNSAKIDTIEKSKPNIKLAQAYIKNICGENNINILEGDALNILPSLTEKYDLIFLDADKEDYVSAYEDCIRLLSKNGLLIVDNLLFHGFVSEENIPDKYLRAVNNVKAFNDLFMNDPRLKSNILTIGDGIGLAVLLN